MGNFRRPDSQLQAPYSAVSGTGKDTAKPRTGLPMTPRPTWAALTLSPAPAGLKVENVKPVRWTPPKEDETDD